MKTISLLALVLALVSCAQTPPRAVIVETKPLTEQLKRVNKSIAEVSKEITKAEESTDRAITKAEESKSAIARLRDALTAKIDYDKALAVVERVNDELADELAQTKNAFKDLRDAKARADDDVVTLQTVVTKLVTQATEANKASTALEKEAAKVQPLKDDLSWWRWYGVIVTAAFVLIVGGYIFIRLSNAAAAVYLRAQVPFLR